MENCETNYYDRSIYASRQLNLSSQDMIKAGWRSKAPIRVEIRKGSIMIRTRTPDEPTAQEINEKLYGDGESTRAEVITELPVRQPNLFERATGQVISKPQAPARPQPQQQDSIPEKFTSFRLLKKMKMKLNEETNRVEKIGIVNEDGSVTGMDLTPMMSRFFSAVLYRRKQWSDKERNDPLNGWIVLAEIQKMSALSLAEFHTAILNVVSQGLGEVR